MVPPLVGLYTAVYGGYEKPKNIPADLGIDAYFYTDDIRLGEKAEEAGWISLVAPHHFESPNGDPAIVVPMLNHKYWKTHPEHALPEHDISIWVDGSMEIVVDGFVDKCLAALGDDDWACMRHPARNCIYPEAEYSATLTWRYDAPSILAQAEFYKAFHPRDWGLIATGFCVRRHNRYVTALCRDWWHEIVHRNHQDQISLPVLMRIHQDYVRMNYNLPWHEWLHHYEHGE